MADKTKVFSKRDKNVDYMNQMLPVEDSFDIVQRDIQIGGKDATFYFIDGFTKDESMLKIMDSFFNIKEGDMPKDAAAFATTCLPYVEADVIGDFDRFSGIFCQESRVCSLTDTGLPCHRLQNISGEKCG